MTNLHVTPGIQALAVKEPTDDEPSKHVREIDAFSEAYQVVRTAVVVVDGQTYRIEILESVQLKIERNNA